MTQPRCIKLEGETESAIKWRKIIGVTSPRGSEKASYEELSETSVSESCLNLGVLKKIMCE